LCQPKHPCKPKFETKRDASAPLSSISVFFIFALQVPLSGGLTAPQMPLFLILLQHLRNLLAEGAVDMAESFGHVLMYGAFADPKAGGGPADGGAVLYNVGAKDHATLLVCRYVHHAITPLLGLCVLMDTLCKEGADYPYTFRKNLCLKGKSHV
jgi:hypothetical protein